MSLTLDVVVRSVSPASDRSILVELVRPHPGRSLPAFEAGSHIDLHYDGLVRQYSLLGSPLDGEHYLICIQDEPEGRGGSSRLFRELRAGQPLRISEPRSMFPLIPATDHCILIGAGIGITPLLAMAETLTARGRSFELHHYAHSERTIPLRDYLATRSFSGQTTCHYSALGDSARDRLPFDAPRNRTTIYVCGPAGFIDHVITTAITARWPEGRVRAERFVRSTQLTHSDDQPFIVKLASIDRGLTVAPNQSIAQVLRANGIQTTVSCEQGMCGSCLTDVLAGSPDHRDEVQTDAEKRSNTQVTICCSRSFTPVLELDL